MSATGAGGAGWHGDAYARAADHHRSYDEWFLARQPPARDAHVIDAGCGSGEFTARVAEAVPDGHVIGVEPDVSMLATARRHTAANLEFRHGRVHDLDAVCTPGWADLVVSRAVFHWIPLADYPRCYAAIRAVLAPGGWLHAESGGTGNVARLAAVLDELAAGHGLSPAPPSFVDAGTALELVEQAGFAVAGGDVSTVAQRRAFDREGLRGFLHTQAAVAYVGDADPPTRAAFLADVDAHLEDLRRHDGSFDQTFVRLVVRCQRPA